VMSEPEHRVHELELERSCAQYIVERLRCSDAPKEPRRQSQRSAQRHPSLPLPPRCRSIWS